MLCSTISLLTSAFIMEPIALRGLHNNHGRIPLASPQQDVQLVAPVMSVSPDHASAIHTVISTGWDVILGAQSLRVTEDIRSVPFYTFSSSLVPAAELARYYTESIGRLNLPNLTHAYFSLEDIIDHPTMMKQYELIISKQIGPQVKRTSSLVQQSWTKNIRRLTVSGTTPTGTSSSPPPRHARRSDGSTSGRSMESMTTGSSQSDEEHDEVLPLAAVAQPKRKMTGMMALEMKKRSSMILGRMKMGQNV